MAVEFRELVTELGELASCVTQVEPHPCTGGPTFIKFGQMLSIRSCSACLTARTHPATHPRPPLPHSPDVLPPPAVYELQKLCDAVPPFPTREAIATIERELGLTDVAQVFAGPQVPALTYLV
jgi:hypothetical protein